MGLDLPFKKVLAATLQASGFKSVASMSRGHPYFDLWAVGSKVEPSEEQMQALAREHMTPVSVATLPPRISKRLEMPIV